jgi:DNA polymerase III delta subunit
LAPWQQAKFLRQAQRFSLEQLLKIHRQLLKIDYEQKTGRAVLPLASQLDLLITDL